jgi:hypothetical protein
MCVTGRPSDGHQVAAMAITDSDRISLVVALQVPAPARAGSVSRTTVGPGAGGLWFAAGGDLARLRVTEEWLADTT